MKTVSELETMLTAMKVCIEDFKEKDRHEAIVIDFLANKIKEF
jgi:hypothetical protein